VKHQDKLVPLKEALAGDKRLTYVEKLSQSTKKFLLLYPNKALIEEQEKYPDFFDFLREESKKSVSKDIAVIY
jgi:hypothetical protein